MLGDVKVRELDVPFYPVRVMWDSGRTLALMQGHGRQAERRAAFFALMWNAAVVAAARLEINLPEFLEELDGRQELVARGLCDAVREEV